MSKSQIAGSVVAGFPSPAEQYLEPPLDLNELLVKRPAATYFVRVQGDSMEGKGIYDGDLLVVDRSLDPRDGDVVIAAVDGEFTVKTLSVGKGERGMGNGKVIRLVAANPKYPDIILKGMSELRLFGKVTAVIHRFH
jgi:DNA polymerase V